MLFPPKEMWRKYYITEQNSGGLHEIRLCHVHLIYISWYRKLNIFCSEAYVAMQLNESSLIVSIVN